MPLGTSDVSWEAKYTSNRAEVSTDSLKQRAGCLCAEHLQPQVAG